MQKMFFVLGCMAAGAISAGETDYNYEHYFRGDKVAIFHYFQPGQASARLEFLGQLPEDSLIQENKHRFQQTTRITKEGTPYQVFSLEVCLSADDACPTLCEECESQQMEFAEDQKTLLPLHLTYGGGREFTVEQKPQNLSIAACKDFLKDKRSLILVGTAIAEQAGVATRSHFASSVGLEKDKTVDPFVHRFLANPESILQQYVERTEKGLFGEPTVLIKDVAELSNRLGTFIFTCNFDRFLQKTGVPVFNVLGGKTKMIEEILERTDVILAIGLNRDPERVLAEFKSINPAGTIVAIDLKQPCYLGDEDYLVSADLREAIPGLLQ